MEPFLCCADVIEADRLQADRFEGRMCVWYHRRSRYVQGRLHDQRKGSLP